MQTPRTEPSLQVQHIRLITAALELGVPAPDMPRLWEAAAHQQRHDALFSPVVTTPCDDHSI